MVTRQSPVLFLLTSVLIPFYLRKRKGASNPANSRTELKIRLLIREVRLHYDLDLFEIHFILVDELSETWEHFIIPTHNFVLP
jgi:hypothetical protein